MPGHMASAAVAGHGAVACQPVLRNYSCQRADLVWPVRVARSHDVVRVADGLVVRGGKSW
jgi:hypothetical protein